MSQAWEIRPRNKGLGRNFDPIRYWSALTIVERHNVLGVPQGTWSLTGRTDAMLDLFAPGAGVMLYRGDEERMSGPMTEVQVGSQTSTVSGVSDLEVLDDRILYPVPSSPFNSQTASAYDNRSGAAEDVLLAYIAANTGDSAASGRTMPALRLPASLGRGKTVSIKGRLGQLSETAHDLAESAGFHLNVLHREGSADGVPYLDLTLTPVRDRTANIRFGTAGQFVPATVDDGWSYTLSRPALTRALVAGGGQLTARAFVERANTDAESLWGARIEQLIDQRQTTVVSELTDAGDDALADASAPVAIQFTVSDSETVRYRTHWNIGDKVGVRLPGLALDDVVREVTTTVQNGSGKSEQISAIVGSRDSSKYVTRQSKQVAGALRDLSKLKAI